MKHKLIIPIVILSALLLAACDDNDADDSVMTPSGVTTTQETTGTPDATGTDGMTGATGTDGMAGATGTDAEEERIQVSISDTEVTVQPEASSAENVILDVTNSSAIDRDILIIRLGADDSSFDLFGAFGDDDVVDRAGLEVVEEATVDANSDHEMNSDMEAGNYVVLTTNVDGSAMRWAEFSISESSAATAN